MKIKYKFIIGFLTITVFFVAAFLLTKNFSEKGIEDILGRNSAFMADKFLDAIDQDIYSKIELVQVFSRSFAVQQTITESNRAFDALEKSQAYISQKDQEWMAAPPKDITPFMRDLINNKLSDELRAKTAFLKDKYGYDVFPEIFMTNKYGVNVAQTGKTSDYRQDDEDWWRKAKDKGIYISDVDFDESTGVYSLAIGVRIDNSTGDFIGVIKGVLNIQEVISIITEARKSAADMQRDFKLVDSRGRIIYATEEYTLFEKLPDRIWNSIRENPSGKKYFITSGDKHGEGLELFSFSFSRGHKNFPGLGWYLIIENKGKEIFLPVFEMRRHFVFFFLSMGLFAIFTAFFVLNPILRSLAGLQDAAESIGAGNLDVHVAIPTNDELNLLGATFNKMSRDLKTAQLALSHEKDQLAITLQSIGDGVIAVDFNKNIVLINKAAAHLTGWLQDEALGRPLTEVFKIVNEETCEPLENPVDQAMRMKRVVGLSNSTVLVSRDGRKYIISDSASPILDRQDRVRGGVLVFSDDTQNRKTLRALKNSEERYRTITSSITDYIYTVSMENGRPARTVHSPMCEAVTGYTPSDFETQPMLWIEMVPEEDRAFLLQAIERFVAGQKVDSIEHRIIRKNGARRWIRNSFVPHYDEQGRMDFYDGLISDITERMAFHEKIVQQNEFLHNVLEALKHPFYVVDVNSYKIVMANSASGFSGQDTTCHVLTHRSERPCRGLHQCPIEEVKKTKSPVVMEHIHYGKDQKPGYFEVHGYPILDKEGNVVQMLEYSLNITERKIAEEKVLAETQRASISERDALKALSELKKVKESLEQQTIVLEQARQQAEKALAVKNEFTSTVSHELRTPLAISKEALSLLLRGKIGTVNEKQREILTMASSNIDRLTLLINDILDASKMEAGKMELHKESVDVAQMVQENCEGWRLRANSKNIRLSVEGSGRPLVLSVDKTRFLQILSNLISNAVKFTPEQGSIHVSINDTKEAVEFSVSDTGPGIAPEDFPKLFNKFQQLRRTYGPGMQGTGLGLNIVKSLVELHGGRVSVKSELGKGATFGFVLPKEA